MPLQTASAIWYQANVTSPGFSEVLNNFCVYGLTAKEEVGDFTILICKLENYILISERSSRS